MISKILVADAGRAHLYSAENLRTNDLVLLKDFSHPESRKKVIDLVSSKQGERAVMSMQGGTYEAKHDPKEVEAENFALELAKMLIEEYQLDNKEKLLLVAPAHFGNLLLKHLHNRFPGIEHLNKDYAKFGIRELSNALRDYIYK